MVDFYRHVFEVDFHRVDYPEFKLYHGSLGSVELAFCPAHIAKNTAEQNRHQFEISVKELNKALNLVVKYNGKVLEEPKHWEGSRKASISDPDGNTIVLAQRTNE